MSYQLQRCATSRACTRALGVASLAAAFACSSVLGPRQALADGRAAPPSATDDAGAAPAEVRESGSEPSTQPPADPNSLAGLLEIIAHESERADDLDDASLAALTAALKGLAAYAVEVAHDERAQELQIMGLLSLARAQLALGNETAAAAAIDEAYRCVGGRAIDASAYGPRLSEFVESRGKLQRTTATIDVRCDAECEVYLQSRISLPKVKVAKGGPYRVLIRAARAEDRERYDAAEYEFVLEADRTIVWPMDQGPQAAEGPDRERARDADAKRGKGSASRAFDPQRNRRAKCAAIGSLAVGIVGVGVGASLLGIDGRCPGGGEVAGPNACPDIYETTAAGSVVLGLGVVALVAGVATLAVASKRKRQHGHQ